MLSLLCERSIVQAWRRRGVVDRDNHHRRAAFQEEEEEDPIDWAVAAFSAAAAEGRSAHHIVSALYMIDRG